jgi:hypothetical protein
VKANRRGITARDSNAGKKNDVITGNTVRSVVQAIGEALGYAMPKAAALREIKAPKTVERVRIAA